MKGPALPICRYRVAGLTALAGFLVITCVGSAHAFFPAAPPSSSGSQGSGTTPQPPPITGGQTGIQPPPPGTVPPPGGGNVTPITPPGTGGESGGGGVPEIDPGSLASALGLLVCGALVLTDRCRRPKLSGS